jgi:hypothetical protein
VSLDPLGGRRLATRYIRRVIFRQRDSADSYGVPHSMSLGLWLAQTKGSPVDRRDLALITVTGAVRKSDPFAVTKDSASQPAFVAAATSSATQGRPGRGEGCAIIILPMKIAGHRRLK